MSNSGVRQGRRLQPAGRGSVGLVPCRGWAFGTQDEGSRKEDDLQVRSENSMGCHLKVHKSFVCTTKRNICEKYEEMKSRWKSGVIKKYGTRILELGTLVRLRYICAYAGPLCITYALCIAHARASPISQQQNLTSSALSNTLSPPSHLIFFLGSLGKYHTNFSQGTFTMPFPPPPVETIGTARLHFSKSLLTADSYADWDNIGFKIREGMCKQAAFIFSQAYDLSSQWPRRITLQHYNGEMERTAIR